MGDSKDSKSVTYCSFCGKADYEVHTIIAGPNTFICDECVTTCGNIVSERRMMDAMRRFFSDAENENAIITIAKAIEAGTVETERLDAQHESAGRKALPND